MKLDDWAAEQQDSELFPSEVRRLYEDGRIIQAWKVLSRHRDRDRARAAQHREALAEMELWLQPLGPNEYPRGTVVRTRRDGERWVVTTWSPMGRGLQSWLCHGSHLQGCLGQVPPERSAGRTLLLRTVGALSAVGLLFLAPVVVGVVLYLGLTPVWAVNGNGVPVQVTLDGETHTLAPHSAERIARLFVGEHTVTMTAGDIALGGEPLELGWGLQQVVLNPNGRAVLYRGEIWYSTYNLALPPDDHFVSIDLVVVMDRIDHNFEEPPDEIYTSARGTVEKTLLYDLDTQPGWKDQAVWDVQDTLGDEAAIAYADRALLLEPEAEWAWDFLAEVDPQETKYRTQDAVEADPTSLAKNLRFQAAWGPTATDEWYRIEYDADPSPLNALLLARSLDRGDPEALPLLGLAEPLDSHHVYLERAIRLADAGLYVEAWQAYDAGIEGMEPLERSDVTRKWLRFAKLAGAPVDGARFEWVVEENPPLRDYLIRAGIAPGADPGELENRGNEALVKLIAGDLLVAHTLVYQHDYVWGQEDMENLLIGSDGSTTRHRALERQPNDQKWSEVYRVAVMLQDAPEQLLPESVELLPFYELLTRPEPRTPAALDAMVAELDWYEDRSYVYAGWGVLAEDSNVRAHAREKARSRLLADEVPYWR